MRVRHDRIHHEVGDDLLVTNPKRVTAAIEKKACNALLLKARSTILCRIEYMPTECIQLVDLESQSPKTWNVIQTYLFEYPLQASGLTEVNQIGSITEAIEACKMSQDQGPPLRFSASFDPLKFSFCVGP